MYRRLNPAARKKDGRRGEAAFIAALLYMILIAALLVAMTTQAKIGQRTTRDSRDYLLANQMANMALSDALYQLNEAKLAESSFPKVASASTQCGITMESAIKNESTSWKGGVFDSTGKMTSPGNLGCGQQSQNQTSTTAQKNLFKSAKWQWYVEVSAAPTEAAFANVSNKYRVYAVGGYNGTMRTITSDLFSMQIRSAFNDADSGTIVYDTAPSSVFSHAVFGNSLLTFNNATVTGAIGTNDKLVTVDAVTPSAFGAGKVQPTFLYDYANTSKGNTEARCALGGKSIDPANAGSTNHLCYNKVRVASQLRMNQDVISNAADTCTVVGETPDWKASDYANPVFYADNNLACYKNVTFDKPTTVIGTGTFGIVASGKISISAQITAPSGGDLILYHSLSNDPGSTGVIDFVDSTPSTLTPLNLHIYSPRGTCNFTGAAITGGIACDKVSLSTSTATWSGLSAGVNQPGFSVTDATLFNRTIWYLGNFDEKAAKNPNL